MKTAANDVSSRFTEERISFEFLFIRALARVCAPTVAIFISQCSLPRLVSERVRSLADLFFSARYYPQKHICELFVHLVQIVVLCFQPTDA